MNRIRFLVALSALVLQGCGDGLAPKVHTDIARARIDWLANRSPNYTFQVTAASSWNPPTLYSVKVENHELVEMIEYPSNSRSTQGYTIDDIWDLIIQFQNDGQLHSAKFDDRGVPISSSMGAWEVDGGLSFEVQHFTRR
jgi:hypothetical protein